MLEIIFCVVVGALYYLVAREHKSEDTGAEASRAVVLYMLLGHAHLAFGALKLVTMFG